MDMERDHGRRGLVAKGSHALRLSQHLLLGDELICIRRRVQRVIGIEPQINRDV